LCRYSTAREDQLVGGIPVVTGVSGLIPSPEDLLDVWVSDALLRQGHWGLGHRITGGAGDPRLFHTVPSAERRRTPQGCWSIWHRGRNTGGSKQTSIVASRLLFSFSQIF